VISTKQGEEIAREWGIPFLETSPKQGTNVEQAFFQLASEVKNRLFGDPEDSKFSSVKPTDPKPSQSSRPSSLFKSPKSSKSSEPKKSPSPRQQLPAKMLPQEPQWLIPQTKNLSLEEARLRKGSVEKEGILEKQGGWVKSWKTRLFILRDLRLYYFDEDKPENPKGVLFLNGSSFCQKSLPDRPFCLEIYLSSRYSRRAVYLISAETEAVREEWKQAFWDIGLTEEGGDTVRASIDSQVPPTQEETFVTGLSDVVFEVEDNKLRVFLRSSFFSAPQLFLEASSREKPQVLTWDKLLGEGGFFLQSSKGYTFFQSSQKQNLLRALVPVTGQPAVFSMEEGLRIFQEIYLSSSLTLYTSVPPQIASYLSEIINNKEELTELRFSMHLLHKEDILALTHSLFFFPVIQTLSFSRTGLDLSSLNVLISFLSEGFLPHLKNLSIVRSLRGDLSSACQILSKLFSKPEKIPHFQALQLSQNTLPSKGGTLILQALAKAGKSLSILQLDFEFNHLDDSSVPSIMEVIERCPQLVSLNLAANKLGPAAVDIIKKIEGNSTLRELDLTGAALLDSDFQQLKQILERNKGGTPTTGAVLERRISQNLSFFEYDIFISYRVRTEAPLAEKICDKLQQIELPIGRRIICFLDKQNLVPGEVFLFFFFMFAI